MGQFLAIGLATKIYVEQRELNAAQLTLDLLIERIREKLYFPPEIYETKEAKEGYSLNLKDYIIYEQLIPFLETIYPILYKNPVRYENTLEKLRTLPPSEWLNWAEGKPTEEFQSDEYGMSDTIKEKFKTVHLHYKSIILSMEGKISMEVYGRQFSFFKYTMNETFKKFSLSGALRIYITG